jgi:putative ABC transport system permease protein
MHKFRDLWPSMRDRVSRTPLAWRNIAHNKLTMAVSIAAITFAIIIMFMEMGFLNGLTDSQTGAFQFFNTKLVLVSPALHILNTHETFPRARLEQAARFDGVKGAYGVYIEDVASYLRNPKTGIRNAIRVIGVDLNHPLFESRATNRMMDRLRTPMTILWDRGSRGFFGPIRTGTAVELADRVVTVAGTFDLGADYYYDGNVLTSVDTFLILFPNQRRTQIAVGLLQFEEGASIEAVYDQISRAQWRDVEVLKKAALVRREKDTWVKTTPAGYIFRMGVAVGFIIGVFICYQILYTDISDHLPQLATMKALGYQNSSLVRLVITQAVLLGVLGFVPAVVMSLGLYSGLTAITGIVTKLTFARIAFVFALTLGMCFVAGVLAVRKAVAVDPAELF